jgi:hypothetical protein
LVDTGVADCGDSGSNQLLTMSNSIALAFELAGRRLADSDGLI